MQIELLDDIGYWPCTLSGVMSEIKWASSDDDQIEILINSLGGNFLEGLSIYHYLKMQEKTSTVNIITFAMSAATIIACGADKVTMPENGYYVIHNVQNWASGDGDELQKEADMLQTHNSDVAKIYAKKTGLSTDVILDMMKAETWLTGTQALEMGFVDELREAVDIQASIPKGKENIFNQYKNSMAKANIKPEDKKSILDGMKSAVNQLIKMGSSEEETSTEEATTESGEAADVSETTETEVTEEVAPTLTEQFETRITDIETSVTEIITTITDGFKSITESQNTATASLSEQLKSAKAELAKFKKEAGEKLNLDATGATPSSSTSQSDAVASIDTKPAVKVTKIKASDNFIRGNAVNPKK